MNREDRQIDKEYPRRDRESMQQIVDTLMPGLKLPDPRTEEEPVYMKAFPKFLTVSEQTRLNVLKMILTEEEYEQVVELYEKEKTLKKHRGVGGDE